MSAENSLVFVGLLNIRLNFMTSEFFGRQRECRFYTAGCGNKMAVSVAGPRTVNALGGPVTPGSYVRDKWTFLFDSVRVVASGYKWSLY